MIILGAAVVIAGAAVCYRLVIFAALYIISILQP